MSVKDCKTIVLVHGAWMTPECWDDLRQPFEAAGYTVHAPAWPLLELGDAKSLRAAPPKGLGSLSVGRIVDRYAAFIRDLPEPPIVIGHSFGGLVVQLLLDQGLGVAGVAIDPAPIGGVIADPVSLMAALPVLARWGGWTRPFTLTRAAFAKSFANTAPQALQASAYEELVVPTSGLIFYQAASGVGTTVKPGRRTAPLMITVGEKDRTVTPYVARAAYKIQSASPAPTAFVEFKGRSHFLIAEPGWEEVAQTMLDWISRV